MLRYSPLHRQVQHRTSPLTTLLQRLVQSPNLPATFAAPSDRAEAMAGLLRLRTVVKGAGGSRSDASVAAFANALFVKLCRIDAPTAADAIRRSEIRVTEPSSGRAVALLTYALPKVDCDEALWEQVVALVERGLRESTWEPAEVRTMSVHISRWGVYSPVFIQAVEQYVTARVRHCNEKDLAFLVQILSSFMELRDSPLFADASRRTTELAAHCSAATVTTLAQAFLRGDRQRDAALREALVQQGVRFAEECHAHGAAYLFALLLSLYSSEFSTAAAPPPAVVGAAGRSASPAPAAPSLSETAIDVFKCLAERLTAGEEVTTTAAAAQGADRLGNELDSSCSSSSSSVDGDADDVVLDVSCIMAVCRVLRGAHKSLRVALAAEITDVVGCISRNVAVLLVRPVARGGFSGSDDLDSVQALLNRYLGMLERTVLLEQQTSKRKQQQQQQQQQQQEADGVQHQQQQKYPTSLHLAMSRITQFVKARCEDFISSPNPPYSLIPHLLRSPFHAAHDAAFHLVSEASQQRIAFPTVQAYQFLLAIGDHPQRAAADPDMARHLRSQFAITVKGIPMIQLCAALKCFVAMDAAQQTLLQPSDAARQTKVGGEGGRADESYDCDVVVERELNAEEFEAFRRQCQETIEIGFAQGMDVRCVLSLCASMYRLGHREEAFFHTAAAYVQSKVTSASSAIHSKPDAAVCLEAFGLARSTSATAASPFGGGDSVGASSAPESVGGEVVAAAAPEPLENERRRAQLDRLRTFLESVVTDGVDDSHLTPTLWMDEYDPANHITPLTEEQQHGWHLLDDMRKLRSADAVGLTKLANEYVEMLATHRPDDVKALFTVFEEKVFKHDRLLKECLEHLCRLGIVTKLSGYTIASIIRSLGAIRFAFYATVKSFLLSVTEEQWASFDGSVLVQIVSGMANLSLRIPGVLAHATERAASVCTFLSPMDTARLIQSLQSLGVTDDAVLSMLMRHASKSAHRFDEGSLTLLFSSTSVHRLLTTSDVAQPLLERAVASAANLSAATRNRISAAVKRSALPRELVLSASQRVAPELRSGQGSLQPKLRISAS